MKLSEKGLKSFDKQMTKVALSGNYEEWDRFSATRQIEFEPDDFKGAVVLKVDEADYIVWLIHTMKDALFTYKGYCVENDEQCTEAFDILCQRIVQAEEGK